MNYQKLDAALAIALNDILNTEESSLDVFIHTESAIDAHAADILKNLGVNTATSGSDIFTATLSPNAISQLTEQPWVKYVKLSQQLRLANRRLSPRKLGI